MQQSGLLQEEEIKQDDQKAYGCNRIQNEEDMSSEEECPFDKVAIDEDEGDTNQSLQDGTD